MDKTALLNQMRKVMTAIEPVPDSCFSRIVSLTRMKLYTKNEYFAAEGDAPTDLAFVGYGTFRAFYRNAEGIEYNKTFFTDNTFMIALTAIISQAKNLINIQALEDSAGRH